MSEYHFTRSRSAPKNEKFFRITAANFPALKGLAIQDLDMSPGERREPHFHPNAAQLDFCISGTGRVGIIGPDQVHHALDLGPGDAAFIPQGYVHWIENTAQSKSRFLLVATHEMPETIDVVGMYAGIPAEIKK